MIEQSRVIMPHVHVLRSFNRGATISGVMLPYLIENLIFSGALEIIITDEWRYSNERYDEIRNLPEFARSYVKVVNLSQRTSNITNVIFEPILYEFGLEFDGAVYTHFREVSSTEKSAQESAMHAHSNFPRFLEALFLKAHFHFDIKGLVVHLEKVRQVSRNPETRISIAGLLGILSTYESVDLAASKVVSAASSSQSDRLMKIILSSEYKALSAEHSLLGSLTNIPHVTSQIKLRTKQLLKLSGAKGLLDYTSKIATVASGVPMPNTALAESLLKESFLPPALDMSEIIRMATQTFASVDPDFDGNEFFSFW